jgi:hypothetical protein
MRYGTIEKFEFPSMQHKTPLNERNVRTRRKQRVSHALQKMKSLVESNEQAHQHGKRCFAEEKRFSTFVLASGSLDLIEEIGRAHQL